MKILSGTEKKSHTVGHVNKLLINLYYYYVLLLNLTF